MGTDLPDETSKLYSYFRRLDRRLAKWRHSASAVCKGIGLTWFLLVFAVLIPAVTLGVILHHRTHTDYVLLSGIPGSTAAGLAPRLQSVLNAPTPLEQWLHLNVVPDFVVRPSCGELDTIGRINAGAAHLGFAEDGLPEDSVVSDRCAGSSETLTGPLAGNDPKMRVLMLLYKSPLHVVARRDRGFKDIEDVTPRTKVYLGRDGSATRYISRRIVEHYELAVEDEARDLDFEQAAQALIDGRVDVAFFLTGLQADVFKKLLRRDRQFQLLPIGQAASLKMLFPYLEPLTIPASIYPNAPTEVQTVGTNTVLVASTALDDWEAYEIMEKMAGHTQELLKDIPLNMARQIDNDQRKDLLYQVHGGAGRFVAHDPPFFLDLHALTVVGTYFSLVYAAYAMMVQFLRHYRVHRVLMAVDRIFGRPKPPFSHLQRIRRIALRLMRRRKISYEEFSRIDDYVKAHHL
jgi:TRAP transporter TAXI family solute receptor